MLMSVEIHIKNTEMNLLYILSDRTGYKLCILNPHFYKLHIYLFA